MYKKVLTVQSERYTIYFDRSGQCGRACISNYCITDMHTLHFMKTDVSTETPLIRKIF